MSASTTPFGLLEQISNSIGNAAVSLPAAQKGEAEWRGIAFRLAGQLFIVPMDEVDEILYVPEVTRVPGVKSWVNGIANVRGRLLAVVDMEQYFDCKTTASNKRSRVLAVRQGDLYSGFVVPEVLGMQAFTRDAYMSSVPVAKQFAPFVQGGYERDGKTWTIFSIARLVLSPEFLQVAV